jgi:Na+-transporting NADH:ubiquinone oxidoreductase subunit NqrF
MDRQNNRYAEVNRCIFVTFCDKCAEKGMNGGGEKSFTQRSKLSLPCFKENLTASHPSVIRQDMDNGFVKVAVLIVKVQKTTCTFFSAEYTIAFFLLKVRMSVVIFRCCMKKWLTKYLSCLNGILFCMEMPEGFM